MSRRDIIIAALLAAGLAALLIPLASMGVDAHHDGIMLKPALDVLSGQVLFRDTFTQYGALTTYLQALVLTIHPGLLTLRLTIVGVYAVSLFFLYIAWRLLLPRLLAIAAGALFVFFIPAYEKNWLNEYWMLLPWSSAYALMFQSIALYAMLNVIRHEQAARWAAILGLAVACIFWCRQPVGIVTTGCIAVIWLALHLTGWTAPDDSKSRIVGRMVGSFFAVHLLILAGIWLSGGGPEWWYQNFVWPGKFAATVATAYWKVYSRDFLHPILAGWLLVILAAAALPAILIRRGRRLPTGLTIAWYVGAGLVLAWQHERVPGILHLRDGGWTMLIPGALLIQAGVSLWRGFARRRESKPLDYYLIAAAAAFSLSSLVQFYPLPDNWHTTWALGPTLGLFVYSLWRWSGWSAPVTTLVLSLALVPSFAYRLRAAQSALAEPYVKLTHPEVLSGMKVSPAQAALYTEVSKVVDRVVQIQPDIPGVLLGNDALFLCLIPNRANPLPYFVSWPMLTDSIGERQRWSYILRVRPLVFFHKTDWSIVNRFYRENRYIPIAYFHAEGLEIAIPRETADAMGVTTYGAPLKESNPAAVR